MKKNKPDIKFNDLKKKDASDQLVYFSSVIGKIKKYRDKEGITDSGENVNTLLIRHLIGEMGGFPEDSLFVIKETCIDFMAALSHPSAKEFIGYELFDMEDLQRILKGLIQFCHTANNKTFIPELEIAYLEENGIQALGRAVALEDDYK